MDFSMVGEMEIVMVVLMVAATAASTVVTRDFLMAAP